MTTNLRRTLLVILVALAAFVGIWAEVSPRAFYDSFPGFGLTWISADGAFNEHLIRDVGASYLGLGAASAAAVFCRSDGPSRVIGLAWAVFGILHFGYHVLHLEGTMVDRVGNILTLGLALLVGILLVLPSRRTLKDESEDAR